MIIFFVVTLRISGDNQNVFAVYHIYPNNDFKRDY